MYIGGEPYPPICLLVLVWLTQGLSVPGLIHFVFCFGLLILCGCFSEHTLHFLLTNGLGCPKLDLAGVNDRIPVGPICVLFCVA